MLRYSTKNYVLLEPSELEGLELLKLIEKQVENDLLLLGIINNKLIFQKLKGHNDPLYEIKVSKQLIEQSLNLWKKSVTKFVTDK